MNVYKHELKSYLKSTILWIAAISCISIIFISFYPLVKSDFDNFMKLINNFPKEIKNAMGITDDFASPIGYYGFVFSYVLLFGAIQSMTIGIGIVSKEQRDKTADFLMTKPISRINILTFKVLSAMTILIFTNLFYSLVSSTMLLAFSYGDLNYQKFILINLSLFLSQIVFFSIGFFISIIANKIKSVLPYSLGIVFMFFAISAFSVTSEDNKLRFITPFQYFKTECVIKNSAYEPQFLITGALIVIVCLILGYLFYKRKDVHAV